MTTTTAFTPAQKLALIKHLASGKTADSVAMIMNTTKDEIVDIARHHGYPDTDKLARAADILTKNLEANPAGVNPNPLAEGGRKVGDDLRPTPRPATPPSAVAAPGSPDTTWTMLNTAKAHPSKRIQSAAAKAVEALDKVKTMLHDAQVRDQQQRKAIEARQAAQAEVRRLEAQLAAAKAKLRGKPADSSSDATPTAADGYPCTECDRTFPTPQGRALHTTRTHRETATS